MPNPLPFLAAVLLGAILGYVAGRLRRDRRVIGDTLDWWQDGWREGFATALGCSGRNPLHKPTTFATLDELAPKVLSDGERE